MSYAEELSKLPIQLRSFLISLILIIPFWYLAIVLFKPNFITKYQVHIPIILSFCLSACHLGLILISSSMLSDVIFKEKDKIKELQNIYLMSCFISVFFLSTFLFIGFYYKWHLITFIEVNLSILLLFILIIFLVEAKKLLKPKKVTNQHSN